MIILNPISQAIQDISFNLITTESITTWNFLNNPILMVAPILICVVVLIIGAVVFRKKSKFFAEEV